VRISEREISAISGFLHCSEYEFIQRFTRLRPQRDGLALQESSDGSCVFLEGKDCRINPVKPDQCAGFPNTWNFPGWREVCEAVPVVEEDLGERPRSHPRPRPREFW
jgi:uncharacterized protein